MIHSELIERNTHKHDLACPRSEHVLYAIYSMIQLTESAQSSAYAIGPHSEQNVQVYILTYIYLF